MSSLSSASPRSHPWEVIKQFQNLDWLVLTKRPELIADRLPSDWGDGYPNVWLGTTVESQDVIERIDVLAAIPACVRFVSAEPLVGPIRFGRRIELIDWIITGCESAVVEKRRPMDDRWIRAIRNECDRSDTPLFHKQYYRATQLCFDGMIDGRQWQTFPESAATRSALSLMAGA